MNNASRRAKKALLGATLYCVASGAWANLITNGSFDTNLFGWTVDAPDTGVTWDTGTAHIGRPGPDGTAKLSQQFTIPTTVALLEIVFDYQWQINRPDTPDFFTAEFDYESTTGTVTELLVNNESSAPPTAFNSTSNFLMTVALSNVAPVTDNGTLRFTLVEDNDGAGTRIQLDNVAASAVPQPASLLLLALGMLALGGYRQAARSKR